MTTQKSPPRAIDPTSILIVDDEQTFRERLARAFRGRGFDVRSAGSYEDAIALATADSPELAVVDLRTPGKNGLELARDLKAIDPSTKIVVRPGYGGIATAVDAIRLGVAYYLAKPADVDDIHDAFRQAEGDPLAAIETETPPPTLARAEWEHISRVLSDCGGNISVAARRLGLHRRSLQRKLSKFPPSE